MLATSFNVFKSLLIELKYRTWRAMWGRPYLDRHDPGVVAQHVDTSVLEPGVELRRRAPHHRVCQILLTTSSYASNPGS